MTRQSLTRIAAGAAVAGLVALGASPAGALPHPFSSTSTTAPGGAPSGQAGTNAQATSQANQAKDLTFLQNAGEAAINARLASLNKVISDLGNVPQGCDVSSLIGTAQADITNLTALEGNLKSATTVAAAKGDVQQIFAAFRVYALVIPVDEMVVATCRMSDVIAKVNALITKLQNVKDPNVAALVTDMGNNTTAAASAISGVATQLEGFTPQSWDSSPGELVPFRQDLRTARKDLEQVRDDAHKIVAILHHDYGQGGNEGNNVNPNANSNTSSSTTSSTSSTTSTTAAA
jgi:hypothetical protein